MNSNFENLICFLIYVIFQLEKLILANFGKFWQNFGKKKSRPIYF